MRGNLRFSSLIIMLVSVLLQGIAAVPANRDLKQLQVDDQLVNLNMETGPYISTNNKQRKLKYIGVNLSGAEFGNAGDVIGTTYDYPTPKDAWYFIQHGMNMFRLPIRWERFQPNLNQGLYMPEVKYLDAIVNYITANNRVAHIDVHNFCRYNGTLIGEPSQQNQQGWTSIAQYAAFFGMLTGRYAANPLVEFTIMNEPSVMNTSLWVNIANAAIASARTSGYKGVLYVDGNRWTGCFSWNTEDSLGDSNAVAMLTLKDPANNLVFDCHNYFNFDNSGSDPTCVNQTVGVERLTDITKWLVTNKQKGLLGEFGAAMSPNCVGAVKYMLDFLEQNSNVWLGGCWWSAGPKWGNYYASIEPLLFNSAPKVQLVQLKHYALGTYTGTL